MDSNLFHHWVNQFGVQQGPCGIPVLMGALQASPQPQEMRDLSLQSSLRCIWGFSGCRVSALYEEELSLVLAVILSLQKEELCPRLHTGNNWSHLCWSHRSVFPFLHLSPPSVVVGTG